MRVDADAEAVAVLQPAIRPPEAPAADPRCDFESYVSTRYGALLGLGYLLTQDRALAEDLVQTALIRCWSSWHRVRSEDPHAYVRRVMVNAHTEWWRRRRGRTEVPSEDPLAEAPRPEYVSGLVGLVEHADLIQALRRLPRRMCAAVVLRYFEDLTEAETAEVMGCSVGTVKSQTHRALTRLRAELGSLDAEEA
ncbi:RNA polymerase sigma-70 factor (sigma-E family) [Kribbella amoyensis]|uniref:RNA polymerase sigma-70 factor (Sigma-E family) n=1 Tax=Kribbella amoyensis TaxID=996641 RepID=A0A561BKH2_9ACTN|nr:SigE family RNA polymerase sigma factor [Kribbella amoyensis]TWD79376.1 RNA polymerase sigma-70 factor (sigma-E family) [Kribbella amoyensis]